MSLPPGIDLTERLPSDIINLLLDELDMLDMVAVAGTSRRLRSLAVVRSEYIFDCRVEPSNHPLLGHTGTFVPEINSFVKQLDQMTRANVRVRVNVAFCYRGASNLEDSDEELSNMGILTESDTGEARGSVAEAVVGDVHDSNLAPINKQIRTAWLRCVRAIGDAMQGRVIELRVLLSQTGSRQLVDMQPLTDTLNRRAAPHLCTCDLALLGELKPGRGVVPASFLGGLGGAPMLHRVSFVGLQLPSSATPILALQNVTDISVGDINFGFLPQLSQAHFPRGQSLGLISYGDDLAHPFNNLSNLLENYLLPYSVQTLRVEMMMGLGGDGFWMDAARVASVLRFIAPRAREPIFRCDYDILIVQGNAYDVIRPFIPLFLPENAGETDCIMSVQSEDEYLQVQFDSDSADLPGRRTLRIQLGSYAPPYILLNSDLPGTNCIAHRLTRITLPWSDARSIGVYMHNLRRLQEIRIDLAPTETDFDTYREPFSVWAGSERIPFSRTFNWRLRRVSQEGREGSLDQSSWEIYDTKRTEVNLAANGKKAPRLVLFTTALPPPGTRLPSEQPCILAHELEIIPTHSVVPLILDGMRFGK